MRPSNQMVVYSRDRRWSGTRMLISTVLRMRHSTSLSLLLLWIINWLQACDAHVPSLIKVSTPTERNGSIARWLVCSREAEFSLICMDLINQKFRTHHHECYQCGQLRRSLLSVSSRRAKFMYRLRFRRHGSGLRSFQRFWTLQVCHGLAF